MKIILIAMCAVLISGCSMFNATTKVKQNGIEVFQIEHPRYSIVEYAKDGDKENIKVDSTGGSGTLDKVIDIVTLGIANEMINPDND